MKHRYRTIAIGISGLAVVVVVGAAVIAHRAASRKLEQENSVVQGYRATSGARIAQAVITLPARHQIVGLEHGSRDFTDETTGATGRLSVLDTFLQTKFIPGVLNLNAPRLDAVVPLSITGDAYHGAVYVVLFWDRGDAAIERSYARLGGGDVVVENISMLPPLEGTDQEYRTDIVYTLDRKDQNSGQRVTVPNEVIIPVVDGHFDTQGVITKQ